MSRTVLLGMNNPLSVNPAYALWPDPPNCTGWRLWKLLQMRRPKVTADEYAEGFVRRNLVLALDWDRAAARARADELVEQLSGARVVVLGAPVRDALRLPPVLVEPLEHRGVVFRQLPHPSGRCRWYNDPKNKAVAALLLDEEYRRRNR